METFISWDINSDPIFDAEGNEVGETKYALIEKIFVSPVERRQGVARKLLADTIAKIKATHKGLPIRVAALPFGEYPIEMNDLVAFYESAGFDVIDTNGHAVIMEL